MVGVDSDGQPLTPLYTWADNRSSDAALKLRAEIDEVEVHKRTGCAIHPSYFPARLRWLRDSDPVVFGRINRWLSPGEYLYQRLFGRTACSISVASATGLFDQDNCEWDSEMLDRVGIRASKLASLTDVDSPETSLVRDWANRWPALAQIPWVPAIGDGASGNLGSGCLTPDSVAVNLGTSGAIRLTVPADSAAAPRGLWRYRLDRNRFVLGAAFSDGGEVYSWMRRTLNVAGTDEETDRALLDRETDSHGLSFLPFLAGERSLGWRPDATATIHGVSLSTDPLDILQAGMEGVALRFRLVWKIIHSQFKPSRIIASGGAIGESRAWQRMLANALGHAIFVTGDAEASSRGAAILALKAAGIISDESASPDPLGSIVEFDPAAHEAMLKALQRQQDLYDRLGLTIP
jgi:gluconokinase